MKTGIIQTNISHPSRLEGGWDIFYGERLSVDEVTNLRERGWEPWISEANVDREVWVRPTTTVMAEVAEVPEVEVTEGGPDD